MALGCVCRSLSFLGHSPYMDKEVDRICPLTPRNLLKFLLLAVNTNSRNTREAPEGAVRARGRRGGGPEGREAGPPRPGGGVREPPSGSIQPGFRD